MLVCWSTAHIHIQRSVNQGIDDMFYEVYLSEYRNWNSAVNWVLLGLLKRALKPWDLWAPEQFWTRNPPGLLGCRKCCPEIGRYWSCRHHSRGESLPAQAPSGPRKYLSVVVEEHCLRRQCWEKPWSVFGWARSVQSHRHPLRRDCRVSRRPSTNRRKIRTWPSWRLGSRGPAHRLPRHRSCLIWGSIAQHSSVDLTSFSWWATAPQWGWLQSRNKPP